jgi:S1-C subfamily serine protease
MNLSKGILIACLSMVGCSTQSLPRTTTQFAKTSAMITLESRKSGGSGVILNSTAGASYVLTNKHVCQLIQVGGLVTTDQGSYPVNTYRVYTKHDLCLIEVLANLHENTKVADRAPRSYTRIVVAGHPSLLPTMVTAGHFADHMTIQLMVDTKPCDGTEKGQEAFMCAFTGAKPVIATLEAQPTTALIMPGSSGSGAFNENGEVAGLVFAGSQGLSYGFIVPHEYVVDFLAHKDLYPAEHPDKDRKPRSFFTQLFKIEDACRSNMQLCRGITLNELYHD